MSNFVCFIKSRAVGTSTMSASAIFILDLKGKVRLLELIMATVNHLFGCALASFGDTNDES